MRKLSFIIALLLCVNISFAQKGKVTSAVSFFTQGKLDKAKELIDEAIGHENCVNWAKAYMVRGQIYQAIFETQDENYKKLSKDPLSVAWDSYQKVIQLDEKNKFEKDLKTQYANLVIDFTNQGVICYNQGMKTDDTKDFKDAVNNFKRVLEINESPFGTQKVDTTVIYNAGVAAHKAGDLDEAIKFYKKSLELNYEAGKIYAMIANILLGQSRAANEAGDSVTGKAKQEEAVKFLHEGHKLYPDDNYMLVELINYYLMGDTPAKAEEFLDAAIKQEPNKAEYYRAKGSLYEKLNQPEKAEAMYIKTLELNPNDFFAQYNLGNIHLNRVIEDHKVVQDIVDAKEYNAALDKVMEKYEAVIPYFEKALELNPNDKNTLTTLKELYFRLRTKNKVYQEKYDKTMEALNNL
ncbi:MAG TPA: tetratricopeptide repeat protein [Candidatus Butyricimonas faecavium]|nr:tetratricopeptide repeat protein [Candidatus Butyricimonas faecavium]